jgi:hypothetical protein
MKRKIFFCCILFLAGCHSNSSADLDCSQIQDITIINKTQNGHLSDTSVIKGPDEINKFCSILSKKVLLIARESLPGYSQGYLKYKNTGKQGVDIYSGKTFPNSVSHHPINQ